MFRIFVGILILLSCGFWSDLMAQNELKIESAPRQGMPWTESLGNQRGFGYVRFTITNATTDPIRIQMALSDEFQAASPFEDGRFRIFLVPEEFIAVDHVTDELFHFLDQEVNTPSVLDKTLKPCEKWEIKIGNMGIGPAKCGINLQLAQRDQDLDSTCEIRNNQHLPTDATSVLELQVDFNYMYKPTRVSCITIPCGEISYVD